MHEHAAVIAGELSVRVEQVDCTLELSAGGATVPFLARYRKEATGGLDEVQLQTILDRAATLKELDDRRRAIIKSIEEQGAMTPELAQALAAAATRAELEDLYLPYRPKRRTRALMAKERGLEPLADLMWRLAPASEGRPEEVAARFVDPEQEVPDVEAALQGARDICAERVAEDAALRGDARARAQSGQLQAKVVAAKREERSKFEAYYDHEEPLARAPSHRILAVNRGEAEKLLRVRLVFPDDEIVAALTVGVTTRDGTRPDSPWAAELTEAVADAWKRLLAPSLETELRSGLKERADEEAINVFAQNLRHLLLAPPAVGQRVVAIDPGLRTGSKVAVIDATGKLLATATLYHERGARERQAAAETLTELHRTHAPQLIAVGDGTGSREATAFVAEALGDAAKKSPVVSVSEQGASVYSASPLAREEFPDLDVSLRGAVSIGRRLQDPLAELTKIEPRSIGVGQYQHDVSQPLLKKKLDEVVASCVNAVGVDLNTASPQLLTYVSGLGPTLAKRVVAHREAAGRFATRKALLKVKGLGPKAFEQAAGFLRVRDGHPLDNSAVHPERYALVEQMARDLAVDLAALVGNASLAGTIDWRRYVTDEVGEPTLRDVMIELAKPGRDPRGDFSPPDFRDDLRELGDLSPDMILAGVVTNVTNFGAFIDVGVHHDGLCHISQLASRFVRGPAEVVKVGDRVKVKVLAVDLERQRLSLSIRQASGGAGAQEGRRDGTGAAGAGDQRGGAAGARDQRGDSARAGDQRPGGSPSTGRRGGATRAGDQRAGPSRPAASGGKGGTGTAGGDRRGPQRPQGGSRQPFNNPFANLKLKR